MRTENSKKTARCSRNFRVFILIGVGDRSQYQSTESVLMAASGSDGAAEWDDEGDANWTREQPPPLPTLGLECTHPAASINADFEVRERRTLRRKSWRCHPTPIGILPVPGVLVL